MKTTEQFKTTIKNHLDKMSSENPLFAPKYANPAKKLDDCITYIMNTVKNSGISGYTDDEVYSMAIHYYEEDKIDVGKPVTGQVVVNHTVELTEEEKKTAREAAIKQAHEDALKKMTSKAKPAQKPTVQQQGDLFG